MGRTREVSKILTSDTSILTLASASVTYATKISIGSTLINTTSFTDQSTVSINNVFSATYDVYSYLVYTGGSTNADLRLQFQSSSGGYAWQATERRGSDSLLTTGQSNSDSSWKIGSFGNSTQTAVANGHIFNPFNTVKSRYTGLFEYLIPGTVERRGYTGGEHSSTSSFSGLNLITSSGNITGTISIYGYKI